MLNKLFVYNFHPRSPEGFFGNLSNSDYPFFIIRTCKRELVIGLDNQKDYCSLSEKIIRSKDFFELDLHQGKLGYQLLLEIICGLHSDILAEHEIVKQFKDAYSVYRQSKNRDTLLMKIIERLFMDSKDIRSKYLMSVGTNSYASLSRQLLFQNSKPVKVLIIGSGNLAIDLINQLKGKTDIFLSARNSESTSQLVDQYPINIVPWKDFEYWQSFDFIANTIGAPITLFDQNFFDVWQRKTSVQCFIDLGYPSVIETNYSVNEQIYRLSDVVALANEKTNLKIGLISGAKEAINNIGHNRQAFFENKF